MTEAIQSYHHTIFNTVVPLLLFAITGGLLAAAVIVSLSLLIFEHSHHQFSDNTRQIRP